MSVPSFLTKNGGTDFINRQKNLFDVLTVAEKETTLSRTSSNVVVDADDATAKRAKRKRTKRFRGKESMFKAPMDPPPRFLKPRYNPMRGKRWTKYSLADVTELSNEGNAAAAFSFLKSIRDRKAKASESDEQVAGEQTGDKHLYTPNPKVDTSAEEEEESQASTKSVFKGGKLIMPEYVVGQNKKSKKVVQKNTSAGNGKEVYLDHIHFQEEE